MKIKLQIPYDVTVVAVRDADDEITGLELTPGFSTPRGLAKFASIRTTNEAGKILDAFNLLVSGATGKVRKTAEDLAVVPQCDKAEEVKPGKTTTAAG